MKLSLTMDEVTKAMKDVIPKGHKVIRVARGTTGTTAIIVETKLEVQEDEK